MARSPKGGIVSPNNGEFYKGGAFLPNTDQPKGQPKKKGKATGKVEIAPYTWEVAPEGMKSIYRQIAGTYAQWNVFKVSLKPFYPFIESQEETYQIKREKVLELIDKWNSGERWINEDWQPV